MMFIFVLSPSPSNIPLATDISSYTLKFEKPLKLFSIIQVSPIHILRVTDKKATANVIK